MKILHIAEFGLRANGVGAVVENIYNQQIGLGHSVKIISTNENIAYKNLNITTIKTAKDFITFIANWTPDAVLFHSMWAMPYIGFSKILKREKIPYAIMMHGADSKRNRKSAPFKKWLANFLWFNKFMRDASAIIYLSNNEYANCISSKNNGNNYIIPNGCALKEYIPVVKVADSPFHIVYIGRMSIREKGLDHLFAAINILLHDSGLDINFQFYGNENDRDIDEVKTILANYNEYAKFYGPAYGDVKENVLRNADIFILTSPSEGMPMGVLEALSYGVPCILTPGTNMADDVAEAGAGWKVDLNAESIADGIIKAVEDLKGNYQQYHESAYTLSRKYNWTDIAKQHIKVMEDIAGNK